MINFSSMRVPCWAASADFTHKEPGREIELLVRLILLVWALGGSGLYGRFFSCFVVFFFFPLKKQLVLSLVSNINKKKKSEQSLEGRNVSMGAFQHT